MHDDRETREKQIGRQIAEYRKQRGLTQEELAEQAGAITGQVVGKYERGLVRIPAVVLKDIADTLNVPISRFFDGQNRSNTLGEMMDLPMSAELIESFWHLPSEKTRADILVLVRLLSDAPQSELPILAHDQGKEE